MNTARQQFRAERNEGIANILMSGEKIKPIKPSVQSSVCGNQSVKFTEMFEDTVKTHGEAWARQYYAKQGIADWEFNFWLKAVK